MSTIRPSSSDKTPIEKRFETLFQINPGRKDGNCLMCSKETSRILLAGKECRPVNMSPDTLDETFEGWKESIAFRDAIIEANLLLENNEKNKVPDELIPVSFKKANDLFDYIDKKQPGTILGVDTECHSFILFKDFNNEIILLDSSFQIFKAIRQEHDFNVPPAAIMSDADLKNEEHMMDSEEPVNLFYMREGKFTDVYTIGIAHSSWNKQLSDKKTRDPSYGISMFDKNENNLIDEAARLSGNKNKPTR